MWMLGGGSQWRDMPVELSTRATPTMGGAEGTEHVGMMRELEYRINKKFISHSKSTYCMH